MKAKTVWFLCALLLLVPSMIWAQSAKDYIKQGQADLKGSRWDSAVNNFKEALKLDGRLLDAQVGMAQAYLGKGSLDPAVRSVVDGIKARPGETLSALGKAYGDAGLWEEASLALTEALRRNYEPVQTGLALANAFLERGLIDGAKNQYENILHLDPNNFMAQVGLADCLRESGQYDQAIEKYDAILQSKPDFAPAHLGKGKCLDRERKYTEAYAEFKEAVKDDPSYPEAHLDLANAFLNYFQDNQGRSLKTNEAITEMVAYTRLRPKDATGFYQLAKIYEMRGDSLSKAQGAQAARRATTLAPGNEAYWDLLGTLLLDTKQYQEALPALEKADSLAPTPDRWFRTGRSYQGIADGIAKSDSLKADSLYGKARKALENSVKLDSISADAWFYLGMVDYNLKSYDLADSAFTRVIARERGKARGSYWRAFTRAYGKKDYDNAAADLETAIKDRPDFIQSYFALARLYLYMGDIRSKDRDLYLKAKATVEGGQKVDPQNPEWDKILKDLRERGVR